MRVASTVPDSPDGSAEIPFTTLEPFDCQKDSERTTSGLATQSGVAYMSDVDDDPRAILANARKKVEDVLATLREQQAVINEQIEKSEGHIRSIDAALAAMARSDSDAYRERPPSTIKEGVLRILGRSPQRGLGALEILDRLRTDFEMNYERTSLSPQLSRLKAERKIRLEQGKWLLVTKENGPAA